jgi:hypothetical protein
MEKTAEQILKELGCKDITEEMEGKTSIRFFEPPPPIKVEPECKPKDIPKIKPAAKPNKVPTGKANDILGNMVNTPEYEYWEELNKDRERKINNLKKYMKSWSEGRNN